MAFQDASLHRNAPQSSMDMERWSKLRNDKLRIFFLSLHRVFWYSHSPFTNRRTFIRTLIKI